MAEEEKKIKKPSKPKNNTLAVHFLASPPLHKKLLYVRETDCLFRYMDDRYYVPVDALTIRRELHSFLSNNYPEVGITGNLVEDVLRQIPMMIQYYFENFEERYISLTDCMISTDSLCPEEHAPEKFTTVHFPFTNEQIAKTETPVFDSFLRSVLVEEDDEITPDEDLVVFVQEMFGYLLVPELYASAAFFLYGDGANGKSTLTNLLLLFFGATSVSAFSIETLTTRPFAIAGLIGKRINICNEDESRFIHSDKFKAMVSGEQVSAERKFGNVFEFRPKTKFIFCTNKMPTFDGVDYGIRRRLKIIPFYRTISDKEKDVHIIKKLIPELPGILRWALEGLKRLRENNFEFTECEAIRKTKADFAKEVSSSLRFFDEFYEKDMGSFTPFKEMYDKYKQWCAENTRKPVSSDKFSRELSMNFRLKSVQQRIGNEVLRGRHVRRKADLPPDIMSKEMPFL